MVSVCIIARNEGKVIESLFENLKSQNYPHKDVEIVLIDSMSTDNTKVLMQHFASESDKNGFACVNVYENEKRIQAAGWNVAIKNAIGDIIIRVDAHTMIPPEFVSKSISCIESGQDVCGGARPNIAVPSNKWTDVLLGTESSMFGSGIAIYRRKKEKKRYVNSIFHGAYRKEVFEKVGGFNEKLGRTEDNEMHYRIREAGYRICYDPEIISYQHVRSTWGSMIRQKYSNGYWVGLTTGVCPKCLALYHFVPLLFVLAIVAGLILGVTVSWIPMMALAAVYGVFCLGNTILLFLHHGKNPYFWISPLIFLSLHVMYGVGTVVGLLKMPWWKRNVYDK